MRWHGILFLEFEKLIKNSGGFLARNRNFVEMMFLVIYALEQLTILLILPFVEDVILFIGVSVLVVLTTIAMDRFLLKRSLDLKNEELNKLELSKVREINRLNQKIANMLVKQEKLKRKRWKNDSEK